jgi:CheY-like chemotaxis protein
MGCKVCIADNGAEGVRAYGSGHYDLVLMDLQMPLMDGLTAAQRIRELEGSRTHTPIVALTANAMPGQLERCMEAGMNGFLTKPLDIARLHDTFERFGLVAKPTPSANEHATGASASAAPVDFGRLHEITDGDAEFARELVNTFVQSGTAVIQEMYAAFGAGDRPALTRAAHKLKGASANVHAQRLRDIALALETQAAQVDQPRLRELIEQLEDAFKEAAGSLQEYAAGAGPHAAAG